MQSHMAMCTKCGTENHESLETCLYCGASLSFKSMQTDQMHPEIMSNPEHRERILEDQYEKLSKSKFIYVTYILAVLLPFIFFGLGSQYPRIKENPHYRKLKPFALFGSYVYSVVTVIIVLNEFEMINI
jgi:uncharacterized membrane protein YvbJ